jgi:trehalose 6-phosphate synthase/phosphatase
MLVQLAVPSRSEVADYQMLKREIDELVGYINGRFGTALWTPIRYLYRSLPQDRLAGLYRDADVALVTPLRDGMNLVAKEYVACQINDPGVLVLSHLAGAAETMAEALLVNPYNIDDTAAKLHRALTMPLGERRHRMRALRHREQQINVHVWARNVVARLRTAARAGRPTA